jgi:hypothetical protein
VSAFAAVPAPFRRVGQCSSYHASKGWGYVTDIYTNEVFFVHYSQIRPRIQPRLGKSWYKPVLYTNEYVEFSIAPEPPTQGQASQRRRACATNITGINGGTLLMDMSIMKVIEYRNNSTSNNSHTQGSSQQPQHCNDYADNSAATTAHDADNNNDDNNDDNNNDNNTYSDNTYSDNINVDTTYSDDIPEDNTAEFEVVGRSGKPVRKASNSHQRRQHYRNRNNSNNNNNSYSSNNNNTSYSSNSSNNTNTTRRNRPFVRRPAKVQ